MSQRKRHSALEAVANVAIGYGVAVLAQMIIFPWFGIHASPGDHLMIGVCFTVVSLARSYLLRRAFNRLETRR